LTENIGLADLAERYGLPAKSVPYDEINGVRFENMSAELVERLRLGCEGDVLILREVAKRLLPGFPKSELALIDMTTRMFVSPTIYGDAEMLKQVSADERLRKSSTAASLGVDESVFRSTKKFVALLESLGETVAMKDNGKGKLIPAVDSKSIYIRDLMERDDHIGDLARAKIDLGSSINESRSKKILAQAIGGEPLSIQLRHHGADAPSNEINYLK